MFNTDKADQGAKLFNLRNNKERTTNNKPDQKETGSGPKRTRCEWSNSLKLLDASILYIVQLK